jgi:tRNA pseudouridine38-40 synthase
VKAATDSPDRRFRLTLHYDGERFHGWQVQPGARTVQSEVESALSRLASRTVRTIAAGRTDTGVHSAGQVVSASLPGSWTAPALNRALNAVLPVDIWTESVEEAAPDFHARYDAVARGYMYRVGTQSSARSPFQRRWCWPLCQPLEMDLLEAAASRLPGTHAFQSFSRTGQPERGYRCTLHRSRWTQTGSGLEYRVIADRFLHHMVRYLVGTMVDVARGRRPVDDIDALLRGVAGVVTSPPAPAAGLFLMRVYYDDAELSRDIETAGLAFGDAGPGFAHA